MEIRAFCPALGAEIMGVDLARPLVAVAIDAIRRALGEFGVVFFRDQQLTPE
jgi:taurine dioxygenase